MIAPLPVWADNPQGRALVARIIAERPDYFIRSGTWIEGGGIKVYKGKTAGQLRQLFAAWWDANFEGATSVPETGNELIERLLNERADLEPKEIGDGLFQVAA
jgi:hypothetical protein